MCVDKELEVARSFINRLRLQTEFVHSIDVVLNPRLRTTAGRAWNRVYGEKPYKIELNANLMDKVGFNGMEQTVAHEFAHILVYDKYTNRGKRITGPHGDEWQRMMKWLGYEPKRTHKLFSEHKVERPKTRQRRWEYRCACERAHGIPTVTHNRIQKHARQYQCTDCGCTLKFSGKEMM